MGSHVLGVCGVSLPDLLPVPHLMWALRVTGEGVTDDGVTSEGVTGEGVRPYILLLVKDFLLATSVSKCSLTHSLQLLNAKITFEIRHSVLKL